MDTQVEQATSSRESAIQAPLLVRTVGIVEHEVERGDLAERSTENALTQRSHALHMPIAVVDREQLVCALSSVQNTLGLVRCSRQRLLAEDGQAAAQCRNRLVRVSSIGRRD